VHPNPVKVTSLARGRCVVRDVIVTKGGPVQYATLKQGRGRGRIDIRSEGSMRREHKMGGRQKKKVSRPSIFTDK